MGKRYTNTEKWNQWFRSLKAEHKLFWLYLQDACDCVGVYEADIPKAVFNIGFNLDKDELLRIMGAKIHIMNGGEYWWIKEFCRFQYMELEEGKGGKPEQNYIKKLKSYGLWQIYKNLSANPDTDPEVSSDPDPVPDPALDPTPGSASAPKVKEKEEEKVIKQEEEKESIKEKERILSEHLKRTEWFESKSNYYGFPDIMNEWEKYLQELRNNGKYNDMISWEIINGFQKYLNEKNAKKHNTPF